MRQSIIKKGINENKIFATGIPLSNRFLANFNKTEIKNSFGLSKDKKTILFFGGGEFGLGGERTMKILEAFIDNIKDEYQMVLIAGKNEDMKKEFEKIVAQKNAEENVFVQGFSTQIPELMSVSNLVVTKPGGLTSSESLVSGLPMVIINPIPGQEEQNAEFLVDAGIALWLKKKDDFNKEISELLADQDRLQQMKIKAKLLAKANSTRDICSTILNAYNEGKYLKYDEEKKGDSNE
jgi:processive 1,2-diacylglycerol beta-glucosyltransferase